MDAILLSQLDELRSLPAFLRAAAARMPAGAAARQPVGGGFSLVEQVCHLRDLELEGYLVRIGRILNEDCPSLQEIDGGKLAEERNYREQDLHAALADFERYRSASVDLLERASSEALQRRARLGSFGLVTLEQVAGMMVEHDRGHRREVEELAAGVE